MKRSIAFYILTAITAGLLIALIGCSEKTVNPDGQDGLSFKARFSTAQFLPQIDRLVLTVTAPDMDTIIVDSWAE
ncbi:hypothetical protein GF377_03670, partial [candidate division GN15 bacterium]|nr:hypothetical protein [candidate division GN15 bacterium]